MNHDVNLDNDNDFEIAVQTRAYYIYVKTGRTDAIANYYQARQQILEARIPKQKLAQGDKMSKLARIRAYDPDVVQTSSRMNPIVRQPIVMSRKEFDDMLFNIDETQGSLQSLTSVLFYRGNVYIGPLIFCQTCKLPFASLQNGQLHQEMGHTVHYQDFRMRVVAFHRSSDQIGMPYLFKTFGPTQRKGIRDFGADWLTLSEVKIMHHSICPLKAMKDIILPVSMIFASMNLPVYVLLWILEFLPHINKIPELTRLRAIEKMFNSVHRIHKNPRL